ncbi:MAG TPA: cation:proton antiporter [Methanocellaceae archaeon]
MLLGGTLLGSIANRLGFSPLIGQMVAGIVLGPMIFGLVGDSHEMETLSGICILFMMFLMGLSIDFEKIMKDNLAGASIISLAGGLATFMAAMSVALLLGLKLNESLLVGISFISTSTAIGFMVLSQIGDKSSRVYKTIMAVGTTDDIIAMLALSLFLSYMTSGIDIQSVFQLFLLVLGFIVLVLKSGRTISEKLINWSAKRPDAQFVILISIIIMFSVAYLSDLVGIASVTGAFLAGTILARSHASYKLVTPKIEVLSEQFFIPIFFVYIGTRIDMVSILASQAIDLYIVKIPVYLVLLIGLIMAVMASKYFATYYFTRLIGGYEESERKKMGISMTPMGEYTLVIGQLGLVMFDMIEICSVLASVVLVTSVITPIMLRKAYQNS